MAIAWVWELLPIVCWELPRAHRWTHVALRHAGRYLYQTRKAMGTCFARFWQNSSQQPSVAASGHWEIAPHSYKYLHKNTESVNIGGSCFERVFATSVVLKVTKILMEAFL
jgi:hypothetical protein